MNPPNPNETELVSRLARRSCWHTDELPDGVSVSHLMNLDRDEGPVEFSLTQSGPWGRLTERLMRSLASSPKGGFYVKVSAVGHDTLAKIPPKASDAMTEPERARMLYRWAEQAADGTLTDREAFDYIQKAGEQVGKRETFERNLRRARRACGEQKQPGKRAHFGRSTARLADL